MPTGGSVRADWRKSTRSPNGANCIEVARMKMSEAGWRKSSRSQPNGECVEAARFVIRGTDWRKSSRSEPNGACVEAMTSDTAVAVRDSKDNRGPALLFGRGAWAAFATAVKRGDLAR